jgi:hypothetical protein
MQTSEFLKNIREKENTYRPIHDSWHLSKSDEIPYSFDESFGKLRLRAFMLVNLCIV